MRRTTAKKGKSDRRRHARLGSFPGAPRFKPTDTADDIADVLVGMFSPSKAESIARSVLAKLKARKRGGKQR